jgi:hypothetical protein
LSVIKQVAQTFGGERFSPRNLNELEVRKQYQTEITNNFAALGNVGNGENINTRRAWDNIKENIKTAATEILVLY